MRDEVKPLRETELGLWSIQWIAPERDWAGALGRLASKKRHQVECPQFLLQFGQ